MTRPSVSWRTTLAQPDRLAPDGFRALVPPITRGSTTLFSSTSDIHDSWDPTKRPYAYGQFGNPTVLELAARVCELEQGYATLVTPGGLAAISLVFLSLLKAGDHVLLPENVFGPTRDLADKVLRRLGVSSTYYPPTVAERISEHLTPATRMIWCESPGTMTFEVQDVPAIATVAHSVGAVVAIDNTWSAGVLFSAFEHGADISVQALTKYVGGHSDLLLGSVTATTASMYELLGETDSALGMSVSPDDAYLATRGLATLSLRLREVQRSAVAIAEWLAQRPEVDCVLHPAFPSCPGHDIWRRDFKGSSGVFSVVLASRFSGDDVAAFIDRLRLFRIGYSWGGFASLVMPMIGTSSRPDHADRERIVRLNIGFEDPDDLIADLANALLSLPHADRETRRSQRSEL